MNSLHIEQFVENNIGNFNIDSGWKDLVRKMLFEFCIAGWDLSEKVYGKEKFGGLRCYSRSKDEETDQQIQNIIRSYTVLSLRTCEKCGCSGKHRIVNFWEQTLCQKHYLDSLPIIRIEGEIIELKTWNLRLSTISKVEFDADYKRLSVFTSTTFLNSERNFLFSWQQPNYYALLKRLPPKTLTSVQQNYLSNWFQNLTNCEICGYIAVHEDTCKFCHNSIWEASPFKEDEKTEYIKMCQMDLFLDKDDHMKLFRHDKSFKKFQNHQILFTKNDLEKYVEELKEDDEF